jgi:putative FmdB family regulatory protein
MPIYAYRCAECGHMKDVLRKLSDPPLVDCPACGAAAFSKQVTAAGFQLKGSGRYVTDFRGGNTGASAETKAADGKADAAAPSASNGAAAPAVSNGAAAPAAQTPSLATPAPAATAAPKGGTNSAPAADKSA